MKVVVSLVLAAVLAQGAPGAHAASPVEGQDYFRVNPAVPTADASKIVVTEFFSYQCPHCYAFAQSWSAWTASLPKDVKADRAAVAIGHAAWVAPARAFYALSALKVVPRIDDAFFAAIHRERKRLTDEDGIADWAAGQGRAMLRLDYSGHGQSSGAFEAGTIGSWAADARAGLAVLPEREPGEADLGQGEGVAGRNQPSMLVDEPDRNAEAARDRAEASPGFVVRLVVLRAAGHRKPKRIRSKFRNRLEVVHDAVVDLACVYDALDRRQRVRRDQDRVRAALPREGSRPALEQPVRTALAKIEHWLYNSGD